MSKYTLFCGTNTYAMSAHAILEEVGADYDIHWITLFEENPDPAFLAASPHCRTPALQTPQGSIFETGAVALYLAEKFPEANLNIATDDPRRGAFLQWFHYLATTLQPEVIIQFHPEFYMDSDENRRALKEASMARLHEIHKTLDRALDDGPYFFGEHPTVPDFILGMQTIWDEIFPTKITEYPNIERHLKALCDRSSVKNMLEQHKTEIRRKAGTTV